MNKGELIAAVAKRTQVTQREVEAIITATLETIMDTLHQGDDVKLIGFGTFEVRDHQEREGRNPATGQPITIPATKVPAFSPGKQFKEKLTGDEVAVA